MQFKQLFFNQRHPYMLLDGAGCEQILQQGAAFSGPWEDTGTYPSLPIFYWFMYLATQSVCSPVNIPFVDASDSTR